MNERSGIALPFARTSNRDNVAAHIEHRGKWCGSDCSELHHPQIS
jgi:hypothetical protein